MSELQTGTVTVTNGSNRVVGDAGCDWSAAVVGDWFSLARQVVSNNH
jgi:hypothetical protein